MTIASKPTRAPEPEAPLEQDDPIVRSIESAPLDPEALTAQEAAELDARLASPLGVTYSAQP